MITLREAQDRGRGFYGWLDTRYSFSFAEYYDPEHMGFSALRVINDDIIAPSAGFDTHGHRDMEIITYVTKGRIAHKDSEGNVHTLPAGEVQLMSAGRGIYHSEFNASDDEELRLLQIWIQPDRIGGEPGYQQKAFAREPGLIPIATPTGEQDSLLIKQDATLYQLILEPGNTLDLAVASRRRLFVQLVAGSLALDGIVMKAGDGAKIEQQETLMFANRGSEALTALVFDLP